MPPDASREKKRTPAGERFFVDTNVLLYSADPVDPAKRRSADAWLNALWAKGAGRLSWQVLHEFYANAVRKIGVPSTAARATVETFAAWQPVEASLGLLQRAWYWMDDAQLPYWDALIVAAAERSSCTRLLSEDFQTGREFGAVIVVNPFSSRPENCGL